MHATLHHLLAVLALILLTHSPVRATDFVIAEQGQSPATILVDTADFTGVRLAARNLSADIGRVCGKTAPLTVITNRQATPVHGCIVAGTLGHSPLIDRMVKQHGTDVSQLRNQWESYLIDVVDGNLVVIGADKRGTIYGIYELSQEMGVSPWYWWADVPVAHHSEIVYDHGRQFQPSPRVKYRGIFLNDEAPCLTSWVKNTWGTNYGGHQFYAKVFELLLRLKANFIWPAMWGWAFYADDPANSRTADDMGIIVGTSHHEPMCRSQKEWHGHSDNPNVEAQDSKSRISAGGKWDYTTNQAALDAFWAGGVRRNRNTEDVVTVGMRGDGDMAMSDNTNVKLMEKIIRNQRKIIAKERGCKASDVPQLWALYKEVMDYYDEGMRVPDDITLLLCDDNWGDVRRVPTPQERQRKGGWGLYYHVDYVGAPRNSKWLNVTPTQNMWEQLSLAAENGIDRLWVLNVGDLKPMEYPIQLFLDMARDPKAFTEATLTEHTRRFCAAAFGEKQADEAARILNLQGKYAGRCTPEMLDAQTYNLSSGEWQQVVNDYAALERDALRQYTTLPEAARDAYQELILFPVQAMANLYDMYYAQAMNLALADKQCPEANRWAARCRADFRRDSLLCDSYNHQLAHGKWNGMMTQKHMGYTSWNDNFRHDKLPALKTVADGPDKKVFTATNNQVVIEAPHCYSKTDSQQARWITIDGMGRTLGALTLRPTTASVKGAKVEYRFRGLNDADSVTVHIIVKSTLDFINRGGLRYQVSLDGTESGLINFNHNLNEKPANIYDIYYPTVARRVVETTVRLPMKSTDGHDHSLVFTPVDPGIVLEKIVVDGGGYHSQYLFGAESLYQYQP